MKHFAIFARLAPAWIAAAWISPTLAQTTGPEIAPKQTPEAAGAAVAIVNDRKIPQSELDAIFKSMVLDKLPADQRQRLDEKQTTLLKQQVTRKLLFRLIDNCLLDQRAEKEDIQLTHEDLLQEVERNFEAFLQQSGQSRDAFARALQSEKGQDLDTYLTQQAADPFIRRTLLRERFLEAKFGDRIKPGPEEVAAYYELHKKDRYTRPPMIHARHILFDIQRYQSDTDKTEARRKAMKILQEARKPGADFAALARAHSECESSQRGGDLGWFAVNDPRAPRFAAEAAKLKAGQVGGLIATEYGYHIVQVMERKNAEPYSLDEVREAALRDLRREKIETYREKYVAELRKTARIEIVNNSN